MRTVFTYVAIVAGLLSFAWVSQAEDMYGRFFVGAGLCYVDEDFDDDNLKNVPNNVNIDNSWGINIFGGYWWLRHLAFEGNVNWYDDFDGSAGSSDFNIGIWTVMLDLKVISPSLWQDRIFPYVRIGGGYMIAKIDLDTSHKDNSDFAYDIGIGCDVYVTERVSVGIDAKRVWGTGDVTEFNHNVGTIRAAYHF